jgi:NAD(P)-dependent dehydrogenase (short-subunit alcohol dehydrogenase family)
VDLDGAVAVVTGGASGIGAAVVERLAAAGARPVVWDRAGGDCRCDVSDPASVAEAMAATLASGGGPPAVLVTAAGIGGGLVPLLDVDARRWDEVLAVNLRGTMLCLQAVGRAMRDAGRGGAVVTVSSMSGRIPDRGMAAYCASKAGVDMLTRVAAAELGRLGIRVNAVAPGVVETPLTEGLSAVPGLLDGVRHRTPLGGRLGSADGIADAVMALLAADWVTGQSLVVDGGLALHSPLDVWGAVTDGPQSPRQ